MLFTAATLFPTTFITHGSVRPDLRLTKNNDRRESKPMRVSKNFHYDKTFTRLLPKIERKTIESVKTYKD